MTKPTMNNTKTEILAAYDKLLKQMNEKQSQVHDPAAEVKAKKVADVLDSAKATVQLSVEDQIAGLQKSITGILGNLQHSFSEEIKKYNTVQEAISLKESELKELFDIEKEAFTLAALVNSHKEIDEKFQAEQSQKRAEATAQLDEIKQQIAEAQQNFRKTLAEEKVQLEVARKREEEEYTYEFNRKKKLAQDQLNDQLAVQRKSHNEKIAVEAAELEKREQEVEARENDVDHREEKIADLEKQVAAIPEKVAHIRKEIEADLKAHHDKQSAIKENSIKKHYEAENRVLNAKIDHLETQVQSEISKNAELSRKLDAAYEKIQEMAIATTNRPVVEYRSHQGETK